MSQSTDTTRAASKGFFARLIEQMQENRRQTLARKAGKGAPPGGKPATPGPKAPTAPALAPISVTVAPKAIALAPAVAAAPAVAGASIDEASPLTAEIKRYAYVTWLLRVLSVSALLNVFVVLMLFLTGMISGNRQTVQLTARPSLLAEAEAMFGKETEVNVDDLLIYLNTVLPLMHRMDDRGSPALPLLRGLVSPVEYEKATNDAARSAPLAKKNLVVQNLVVQDVDDVVTDKERGRVSAYVRGYLAIIVQSTGKPVLLPYRAEVLLEIAPPSRLNRFPFVLIRREWRIGNLALDWDGARAQGKATPAQTPIPAPASKTPAK